MDTDCYAAYDALLVKTAKNDAMTARLLAVAVSLGKTEGDVAKALIALKVKGKRGSMCDCPAAKFLSAVLGAVVKIEGHYIFVNGDPHCRHQHPEILPLFGFAEEFDGGKYGELCDDNG